MSLQVISHNGIKYLMESGSQSAAQGAIYEDDGGIVSKFIKHAVREVNQLPEGSRVLVLGGGTFTIPKHAREDISLTIVENNPRMEVVAQEYFGWVPRKNGNVILADANTYQDTTDYDLIIVDLFADNEVPQFARNKPFYDRLLTQTDRIIVNEYNPTGVDFNYGREVSRIRLAGDWHIVTIKEGTNENNTTK